MIEENSKEFTEQVINDGADSLKELSTKSEVVIASIENLHQLLNSVVINTCVIELYLKKEKSEAISAIYNFNCKVFAEITGIDLNLFMKTYKGIVE